MSEIKPYALSKITFTTDSELTWEDIEETSKLAEEFFGMEKDSEQIPADNETKNWILKYPESDNAIKFDGKVIGFTFIIPCNKEIMNSYLNEGISERELFEKVKKKINYSKFDCIYLCSTLLRPEFRGKGLALRAIVKSIEKMRSKGKIKPVLFFEGWSEEGKELAYKVAEVTGLEIRERK